MKRLLVILPILILCTACTEPTAPPPSPTPIPSPTPSPTPKPKRLTVCMPEEPDSLYLYGTDSLAARHVWQAIYDGPLDSRDYDHRPVILTELPSLADGTAAVETFPVQAGDRVLAADGGLVELALGSVVENVDGERVTFDGTPILMPRMVVTFTLRTDLGWSDGEPLTADDSVFSFELAADPATPADKHVVERTSDYRAADSRTVVWRGVPGFLDRAYWLNVWHPLPRHAWGHLSPAELLTADVSTRRPLGWGPFAIREWVSGHHLVAVRNPLYFRVSEGLPRVDELTFRFIANPVTLADELASGRCDVVTHEAADAVLDALDEAILPQIEALTTQDRRWELLVFGITPAPEHNRPDFFEDVRVRQAFARCVDRQAVANEVLDAEASVLHGYLPPEHPLYAGEGLTTWTHDPEAGKLLLAQVGWYDEDGDSVREAHGIPGIADGTSFRVTYRTTDDPLRIRTAQLIQPQLEGCGIDVIVETMPAEVLFAPGPEGPLFGRRFDLAQFSWRAGTDPLCDLFLSSQMPGVEGWDRPNVAGFIDGGYDSACRVALGALPRTETYITAHVEAQRIFSERLPVLPLFQRQRTTLARASVTGLAPNPTEPSELWTLELLDVPR